MSVSQVSFSVVQSAQLAPLEPHAASIVPARQLPCGSQHPWHVAAQGHIPPLPPKPVWQLPLVSQQPVGQVAGPHVKPSHSPFVQNPVAGHTSHVPPPKPQALDVPPGWQTSFASQQPGHVSSLQLVSRQFPPTH
jgi:hypothetical protein